MNRYSLMFAVLVAASFGVHSTQSGDSASSLDAEKKHAGLSRPGPQPDDPVNFIRRFLGDARTAQGREQNDPQILFATVPHPTETHLAAAFDHNVDALQDGLQASGYLFDSSWIPWKIHQQRDQFDDDTKEQQAKAAENDYPGVLLFRSNRKGEDPYRSGLVVFLLTEKPTGGIDRPQLTKAISIVRSTGLSLSSEIRILGPSYSGSFPSLVPIIGDLLTEDKAAVEVMIRSGSFTSRQAGKEAEQYLAAAWPAKRFDFASTNHDYLDRMTLVQSTLCRIGIEPAKVAILTEGESLYGGLAQKRPPLDVTKSSAVSCPGEGPSAAMWSIPFPRDISSLREGYESQGLFNSSAQPQPMKRYLTLKDDAQGEGDSVRTFGGPATLAAQESVLFGISEFLKKHEILAAVILATNEQDRYFLTQFLHSNNSGVRVVVLDPTRIFLRGATSQFRGDMFVGEFPMLPLLHDWTGGEGDRAAHIFADGGSQGIYFSAIDMFAHEAEQPVRWYPEYTEPHWNGNVKETRPPEYVVSLGSNAMWEIDENVETPVNEGVDDSCNLLKPGGEKCPRIEMPFILFEHDSRTTPEFQAPKDPGDAPNIHVGRTWKILFAILTGWTVAFCIFFWYANPLCRNALASFAPTQEWRFWLFKVAMPAFVVAFGFRTVAWSVTLPRAASPQCFWCGVGANLMTVLAPLAIATSALCKAQRQFTARPKFFMLWPFIPVAAALVFLPFAIVHSIAQGASAGEASAILTTYRQMHWESGLSLIPTTMLFLAALLVWACQAGSGAALLGTVLPSPSFPQNITISEKRANAITQLGSPLPLVRQAKWLWIIWAAATAIVFLGHFTFKPFLAITSLEPIFTTRLVFVFSGSITSLLILDLLQFLWLWDALRGFLLALSRVPLKRSFIPIQEFKWSNLWSFKGVSFHDRREINTAIIASLIDLAGEKGLIAVKADADTLKGMHKRYNSTELEEIPKDQFKADGIEYRLILRRAAGDLARMLESPGQVAVSAAAASANAVPQAVYVCQCKDPEKRFKDEIDDLAAIPEWQQGAEKYLCLLYISFIQVIVARLHTLLISVSAMFSLMALGIAIYPFLPFSPLLAAGITLVAFISWAFFKVFSEMNDDPVLSRIVAGDDSKLQGNPFMKLGEAIALPLLTLASSLLPGGAGRLLELAQTIFNHGQ